MFTKNKNGDRLIQVIICIFCFFTEEKMYTKSKPQKKCFGLINIFSIIGVMDENLTLI